MLKSCLNKLRKATAILVIAPLVVLVVHTPSSAVMFGTSGMSAMLMPCLTFFGNGGDMPNEFYAYEFDYSYAKQMIQFYYLGKGKTEYLCLLTGAWYERWRFHHGFCHVLYLCACPLLTLEILVSISEELRNNAITLGIQQTAKDAAKQGINISTVLFSLFGRY